MLKETVYVNFFSVLFEICFKILLQNFKFAFVNAGSDSIS